jgi:hypothetical protein
LDAVLNEIGQRRCASCHGYDAEGTVDIPRTFWTQITNPQQNSFLTAPLAHAAGGTERCGQVVFQDVNDPDYQAILKTFEETTELTARQPRLDMLGGLEYQQQVFKCRDKTACSGKACDD